MLQDEIFYPHPVSKGLFNGILIGLTNIIRSRPALAVIGRAQRLIIKGNHLLLMFVFVEKYVSAQLAKEICKTFVVINLFTDFSSE